MRFRAPSETCLQSPTPRRSCPPAEAGAEPVARRNLSWASLALRHIPDQRIRMMTAGPPAAACHVRGLDTPLAASNHWSSRRQSAGASLGFALQGVPLAHGRYPSRGPCPPDVPAALRLPGEERERAAAFKASFPRRVRAAAGRPKPSDRRCLPGLRPFRAFPPSVRAPACSRGAGPRVLGQGDVPTRLDLRASRTGWVGLARFRAAGSHGIWHLATVMALRSSRRGAGSWLRLAREVA